MSELVLGDGIGVVDLVAQDHERDLGQLLHLEQRVQLGLRFGESLVVLGVDEEDDSVDLGEVVSPQTAGCCVVRNMMLAHVSGYFVYTHCLL